jgi:hypothetical protein
MQPIVLNKLRLRFVALAAGVAGALVLAEMAARYATGIATIFAPMAPTDRLTLLFEPLSGIAGVCAGIGLWKRRRWGATAFTVWVLLILAQVALTAFLISALAGFATRPTLRAVELLLVGAGLAVLVIRVVRRWLLGAIASLAAPEA